VVPIDDTHTQVVTWRHFRDGDDPKGLTDKSKVGFGSTDFYGQDPDRPYEIRQRDPGDYEAWVSQGPKNIHARENLSFTDRGVAKVRRKLRNEIRSVAVGNPVKHPTGDYDGILPTYAGDTMLRIPVQDSRDDGAILKEISFAVAGIFKAGDEQPIAERKHFIIDELKKYEGTWA
jgi:hypothetical protein